MVAAAVVGSAVVGGAMSSRASKKASSRSAGAQEYAAELQVEEQRHQFDAIQKLLAPYVKAGTGALGAQQDMLGLNGAGKQQQSINALEKSPQFTSLIKQGENAILQNASATGGLRGGNLQGALMEFRPQVLSQLIESQFSKLGGLTSIGQNAAAMTGNAGMNSANQISNAYGQMGAARAGAALAAGRADAGMWSGMGSAVGMYAGMGDFGSQPSQNYVSNEVF